MGARPARSTARWRWFSVSRKTRPPCSRAMVQGINTVAISPKNFASDADYDNAVFEALQASRIDLICLAGYMRLLGRSVLSGYRNRILNVHPALIPSFCGKGMYGHHVHEAVLARGVKYTGVTVHMVDRGL